MVELAVDLFLKPVQDLFEEVVASNPIDELLVVQLDELEATSAELLEARVHAWLQALGTGKPGQHKPNLRHHAEQRRTELSDPKPRVDRHDECRPDPVGSETSQDFVTARIFKARISTQSDSKKLIPHGGDSGAETIEFRWLVRAVRFVGDFGLLRGFAIA